MKLKQLVTPLLISVQDFAFLGRLVSLLVADAPVGSHPFRFSAGVFVLPSNQQLEAVKRMKPTFTIIIKPNNQSFRLIVRITFSFVRASFDII
ncbi:hypothetical protein F3K44_02380 [Bacillus megaterium]|nr:hypothetical protein [Priestia megaterium]